MAKYHNNADVVNDLIKSKECFKKHAVALPSTQSSVLLFFLQR